MAQGPAGQEDEQLGRIRLAEILVREALVEEAGDVVDEDADEVSDAGEAEPAAALGNFRALAS